MSRYRPSSPAAPLFVVLLNEDSDRVREERHQGEGESSGEDEGEIGQALFLPQLGRGAAIVNAFFTPVSEIYTPS